MTRRAFPAPRAAPSRPTWEKEESLFADSPILTRARRLLVRPSAWLDQMPGGRYALRLDDDRRIRPMVTLDEATFRALVVRPGLRVRPGGGWVARPPAPPAAPSLAGSPGRIPGEREVIQPDGDVRRHRANLGESPVAWLARHRDPQGQPWLTPAEVAAAERLRLDAERAMSGPSLTMRWDALPRSGTGSAARMEPGDRALAAGRRVARALDACGPDCRAFVEQACIRDTALQAAERALNIPRRQGKRILKQGLHRLAAHYGLG